MKRDPIYILSVLLLILSFIIFNQSYKILFSKDYKIVTHKEIKKEKLKVIETEEHSYDKEWDNAIPNY